MFFHRRVFIIEMFLYAVVDEACRATNVLLIAAVTRELAYCISSLTQSGVRDRAFVSSAFALLGDVGWGLSERADLWVMRTAMLSLLTMLVIL